LQCVRAGSGKSHTHTHTHTEEREVFSVGKHATAGSCVPVGNTFRDSSLLLPKCTSDEPICLFVCLFVIATC
jgi:hypothetical protein